MCHHKARFILHAKRISVTLAMNVHSFSIVDAIKFASLSLSHEVWTGLNSLYVVTIIYIICHHTRAFGIRKNIARLRPISNHERACDNEFIFQPSISQPKFKISERYFMTNSMHVQSSECNFCTDRMRAWHIDTLNTPSAI